jgi:hypothetical protein
MTLGQTEYRYRGDAARIAFRESTFRLVTDNNNPSVAWSMVDVAEARNWQGPRVSGNEDFKRLVWLEASLRGVKTIGYATHNLRAIKARNGIASTGCMYSTYIQVLLRLLRYRGTPLPRDVVDATK